MTKEILNLEQEEILFEREMEYEPMYTLRRIQMTSEDSLEENQKRYKKEARAEQYYKALLRVEEDIQSMEVGLERMKYRGPVTLYGLKVSNKFYTLPKKRLFYTPPERRLNIKLKSVHLEDQKDRLVRELGLNQAEAEIISDMVRRLAEVKIKEASKQWSESVKKAFANLMTAILIEETKAIKPQRSKRAMIGTNYKDISVCPI